MCLVVCMLDIRILHTANLMLCILLAASLGFSKLLHLNDAESENGWRFSARSHVHLSGMVLGHVKYCSLISFI